MSLLWQTVHSHGFLRSDARLVTVEGRDMEHVAVCADPDRLHLTVSRQRSRMGRAARAEDLKRHIMQCITYHPHDNVWIISLIEFTLNRTDRTFPQLLQWCFLRITVNGALQAMQELQASSGTQSGGSAQSQKETVNTKQSCHQLNVCWEKEKGTGWHFKKNLCGSVCGFADLRTGPHGPWLPIPMRKWSPDTEHSPPGLRCA